jgi:hypothetical protein
MRSGLIMIPHPHLHSFGHRLRLLQANAPHPFSQHPRPRPHRRLKTNLGRYRRTARRLHGSGRQAAPIASPVSAFSPGATPHTRCSPNPQPHHGHQNNTALSNEPRGHNHHTHQLQSHDPQHSISYHDHRRSAFNRSHSATPATRLVILGNLYFRDCSRVLLANMMVAAVRGSITTALIRQFVHIPSRLGATTRHTILRSSTHRITRRLSTHQG